MWDFRWEFYEEFWKVYIVSFHFNIWPFHEGYATTTTTNHSYCARWDPFCCSCNKRNTSRNHSTCSKRLCRGSSTKYRNSIANNSTNFELYTSNNDISSKAWQ